jgi:hypothetical protein
MPVLARRRHEFGEPVEELKGQEVDDAIGFRPRGLPPTTPPDPVGRPNGDPVPREHVADLGDAAGWAAGQDAGRRTKPSLTATLPEVRAEIAAQQLKLAETLAARDATAAHAATDVLAACARAIPGKTEGLDEATLQRVTGMANNAAKAWGQVAHDADHGNFEKAQREAGKAEASYRLLEARLAP